MRSKIRADKHSLYFRANGNIYRPVPCKWWPGVEAFETVFAVDEYATVNAYSGTVVANAKKTGLREYWYSHGCYFDEKGKIIKDTERFWCPLNDPD